MDVSEPATGIGTRGVSRTAGRRPGRHCPRVGGCRRRPPLRPGVQPRLRRQWGPPVQGRCPGIRDFPSFASSPSGMAVPRSGVQYLGARRAARPMRAGRSATTSEGPNGPGPTGPRPTNRTHSRDQGREDLRGEAGEADGRSTWGGSRKSAERQDQREEHERPASPRVGAHRALPRFRHDGRQAQEGHIRTTSPCRLEEAAS